MKSMFGYFKDNYYRVKPCKYIVVPDSVDYKKNAVSCQIFENLNQCEIDIYAYHTDLVSECNSERVAFMKQFLLSEEIKEIKDVNNDYVVAIDYDLFNKDGKLISSGQTSVKAKYCNGIINNEINEHNTLEYRKGFVFDGRIEIQVPTISRYGIKNVYTQHPYTIRFKKISVYSTIGDKSLITESDSQMNFEHNHYAAHAHYECHRPDDLCYNNFGSHFLTNAKVGTTIIDQVVVPAELETPIEFETIPLCEIPCNDNEYVVKINNKLNLIIVNLEVFLDNYNEVYNNADIESIIELNNQEEDLEIPDTKPDEGTEENPENPSDEEKPSTGEETEDSGNTGENENPSTGDNTEENGETGTVVPGTGDSGSTEQTTEQPENTENTDTKEEQTPVENPETTE